MSYLMYYILFQLKECHVEGHYLHIILAHAFMWWKKTNFSNSKGPCEGQPLHEMDYTKILFLKITIFDEGRLIWFILIKFLSFDFEIFVKLKTLKFESVKLTTNHLLLAFTAVKDCGCNQICLYRFLNHFVLNFAHDFWPRATKWSRS